MKKGIVLFIVIVLVAAFFAADYFFDVSDYIIKEKPVYEDSFLGDVNVDIAHDDKTKNEAAMEAFSLVDSDDFKYLIYANGNHSEIFDSSINGVELSSGIYSISEWQFRTILNDIYDDEGIKLSEEDVDACIKASLAVLDAFSSDSHEYDYQFALNSTGDYTKDHVFTAFGCEIKSAGHPNIGKWCLDTGTHFSCDNKKLLAAYIIEGYKTTSIPEMMVFVNADVTNNGKREYGKWLPEKGDTKNVTFLVRYEIEKVSDSLFEKSYYRLQVRDIVVL